MTIKQQVLDLHDQGLTVNQMKDKTGYSSRQIHGVYSNIKGLYVNRHESIEVTDELEQFLIGSFLGDGCFHKIGGVTKTSRLTFGHSTKQKEYVEYKSNLLQKYNLFGSMSSYTHVSDRYKQGECTTIQLKSKAHPIFIRYRDAHYPNNKKTVHCDLVKKLKPFGLAIWYMDDGSVTNNSFSLSTNSFSKKEIDILKKVLKENFNINSTVHKSNILYILAESRDRFIDIIKPYVINSMEYKLTPYKLR